MKDCNRLHYGAWATLDAFAKKRERAKTLLRRFLGDRTAYVGFSGGKDSTACLILLAQIGATDIPVVTQADDLDWPDKRAHCERVVAHLGFTDYTYAEAGSSAMAQFAACDFVTKKKINERDVFHATIRRFVESRGRTGVVLGMRAEESRSRRMVWRSRGYIYDIKGGPSRCLPIADWSGIDVFALIVSTGTPYFHLYDRDDEMPPHERRMAWLCNPEFVDSGGAAFLRRYYPREFSIISRANPTVRLYS